MHQGFFFLNRRTDMLTLIIIIIIIIKISGAPNQHIRMFFEGSCDMIDNNFKL